MTLLGLPWTTLLAIGGAVSALTVALYILKLRRRPVPVVFAPIWQRVLRDREASQLFSRLQRLLSLLLQLVLIALLVLALGDPRAAESVIDGRHIVVLLDASASMKSVDVEPSRFEHAKSKVRELVSGLGGSDRMLVAKMDATLTPLTTLTGSASELGAALSNVTATDTRADLRRGLSFALDSLRDLSKPEIIVVSDGALGDVDAQAKGLDLSSVKLRYLPVGKSGDNVAISAFSVRRYPLDKARHEAMLQVTNTTEQPRVVELELLGDGDVIDLSRLSLGPKERLSRFYEDLGGASQKLEAKLRLAEGQRDDFPVDDHAYALMPERRRARVLVVTKGNTYLEAALLLDEYLDVKVVDPGSYPPSGEFDVTIFDAVAPPVAPNTGASFYLNPPEEGSPVPFKKAIRDFGFDTWDRKSPLLRWMAMDLIQVAKGHAFKPEKDDHVVGASALGPILVTGRREGRRFVALGFDPRDSDLVLRVAWPLLVLNTINSFVEEDASYLSSYRTGEVWRLPAPPDVETAVLEAPGGNRTRVAVEQARAVYFGEESGFYRLLRDNAENAEGVFAANLGDIAESYVEPAAKLEIGGQAAGPVEGFSRGVRRELWIYLVLAAVALSVIEWLTYHRRITV